MFPGAHLAALAAAAMLSIPRTAINQDLDGLYVVRTSVSAETLSADEAVRAYEDLARWSGRSDR